MARPGWNTLAPGFRTAIVTLGAVELALLVAAQVDITRRPAKAVAGPKGAWRLITLIELIGPVAYFVFGRVDPKQRRRKRRHAKSRRR